MDFGRERIALLIGEAGIKRLKEARVAVVGLGAVGSFATESLSRSGIGYLRLIDFDQVRPSNLNRQIYALRSNLGEFKVDLAARRISDIHPDIVVDTRRAFFCGEVAEILLEGHLDFIIDAIDSVGPKVSLISEAVRRNIPIVTAMGSAGRFDPGQIRCSDISEVKGCRLARHVRKKLHRLGIYTGITAVWSEEAFTERAIPHQTWENLPLEEEIYLRGRVRTPLPSLIFVPATVGIRAASHVLLSLLTSTRKNEIAIAKTKEN